MSKITVKKLLTIKSRADVKLSAMSKTEQSTLGKKWDIEHAYYSSVLEGSRLDKNEFEKLAQNIQ